MIVAESLEMLPAAHRNVVRLRLEGFEVAEIANECGRSKRTVERLLQESRERLRTALKMETEQ
jgi:RNA polymerase sigma-70 factor, ECF subfamily